MKLSYLLYQLMLRSMSLDLKWRRKQGHRMMGGGGNQLTRESEKHADFSLSRLLFQRQSNFFLQLQKKLLYKSLSVDLIKFNYTGPGR